MACLRRRLGWWPSSDCGLDVIRAAAGLGRRAALGLGLAGFVATISCAETQQSPLVEPSLAPFEVRTAMLESINTRRRAFGLAPLSLDLRLSQAAQSHVDDMITNDFVSHTGSDGGTVVSRGRLAGYAGRALGENLQAGLPTAAEAVAAWMDSPGHRDNVLRREFRHLGVGYRFVRDDDGTASYGHYWATVFGAPG